MLRVIQGALRWFFGPSAYSQLASDAVTLGLMILVVSSLVMSAAYFVSVKFWAPPTLEAQVQQTMRALEANSKESLALLEKLQAEMATRIARVKEAERQLATVQERRKLLDLTPEQRRAVESLVDRPKSLWSFLASWDFLIGGVLIAVVSSLGSYVVGRRSGARVGRE